jgi:hypothetical protein
MSRLYLLTITTVLLLAPAGYSGIGLGFLHPLPSCEPEICQLCRSLPPQSKEHVYIFLVNGLDPLYYGNLNGLCEYVRALGFKQCETGQMTAIYGLRNRILRIRADDSQGRIVLVGFSAGANCVRSLAHALQKDNVTIDLLVYVGGITVFDTDYSRPENARRIVNLTGQGQVWLGSDRIVNGAIRGARNERLPVRHFALPSYPRTIEILTEELLPLTGYADPSTLPSPAGCP